MIKLKPKTLMVYRYDRDKAKGLLDGSYPHMDRWLGLGKKVKYINFVSDKDGLVWVEIYYYDL